MASLGAPMDVTGNFLNAAIASIAEGSGLVAGCAFLAFVTAIISLVLFLKQSRWIAMHGKQLQIEELWAQFNAAWIRLTRLWQGKKRLQSIVWAVLCYVRLKQTLTLGRIDVLIVSTLCLMTASLASVGFMDFLYLFLQRWKP
jgi:hypothetical protein